MLFNLKSIVLYGLLSVAAATPIFDATGSESTGRLEARMAKKKTPTQDFKALDGSVIPVAKIVKALGEARMHIAAGTTAPGRYPKPFGNKMSNTGLAAPVFAEKATGADSGLLEYPIQLPGERYPGSVRIAISSGATANLFGVMQHPPDSDSKFKKLSPMPPKDDCAAESSKDGKKKSVARSVWDLVKRKVTGKKATPATTGKACAFKPKPKAGATTPKKGTKGTKKGTKKATRKGTKKGTKKATRKGTKKGTKKATRKGKKTTTRKRPARKTAARKSRKGGKRGGRMV